MKYGLYELKDFEKIYSSDIVAKCVKMYGGNEGKARDYLQLCHDMGVDIELMLGD